MTDRYNIAIDLDGDGLIRLARVVYDAHKLAQVQTGDSPEQVDVEIDGVVFSAKVIHTLAQVDPEQVADAVDAAVADKVAGLDLLEGGTFPAEFNEGAVFAVVDADGRRTWLEVAADGGPTARAAELVATATGPAVAAVVGLADQDAAVSGLSFAVVDQADRLTWLQADRAGRPSRAALRMLHAADAYPTDDWAHWGDSTTFGEGETASWCIELAALTGRRHHNGGWSGQVPAQIAARQGGVPARCTVAGDLIPTDGPVAVTAITRSPLSTVLPNGQPGTRSGRLADVPGRLDRSGDAYTFTRTGAGEAVPAPPGSLFLCDEGLLHRDRIATILVGRNMVMSAANIAQAVRDIRAMIDHVSPDVRRVIVIEVTARRSEPLGSGGRAGIEACNAAYRAAFPAEVMGLTDWLQTPAAAAAAGIAFTVQDQADIAAGVIPESFMSDDVHFSRAGYRAVAYRLFLEAQTRGWL